jgi:hypothetical protein
MIRLGLERARYVRLSSASDGTNSVMLAGRAAPVGAGSAIAAHRSPPWILAPIWLR